LPLPSIPLSSTKSLKKLQLNTIFFSLSRFPLAFCSAPGLHAGPVFVGRVDTTSLNRNTALFLSPSNKVSLPLSAFFEICRLSAQPNQVGHALREGEVMLSCKLEMLLVGASLPTASIPCPRPWSLGRAEPRGNKPGKDGGRTSRATEPKKPSKNANLPTKSICVQGSRVVIHRLLLHLERG